MKMIKPWGLDGSNTTSNAIDEPYQEWAQVGRDLLQDTPWPSLDSIGDTLYYAYGYAYGDKTASIEVGTQTLSTGVRGTPFLSTTGIVKNIKISPNGTWMAIARSYENFSGESNKVEVYEIASGILVYSGNYYNSATWKVQMEWSSDSEYLAYEYSSVQSHGYGSCCIIIPSSTWSNAVQTDDVPTVFGTDSRSRTYITGIAFGSDNTLYISGRSYYNYSGISKLFSVDAYGSAVNQRSVYIDSGNIIYNSARDEVIVANGKSVSVYSQSLSPTITPLHLAFSCNYVAIDKDGTEFIAESPGNYPRHRRFSLSDYSEISSFSEGSFERNVVYTDDYILYPNGSGYTMIDRSDNSMISATNPSVVNGDLYIIDNKIYEALSANSDKPTDGVLLDPPTWVDNGYVNSLRMIDGKLDSKTTSNFPLAIEVSPLGLTNAIALLNIEAATVRVTAESAADGAVYDSGEVSMIDNSNVMSWYDFFWQPYDRKSDITFTDLPAYSDMTINVYVENNELDTSVGELVVGQLYRIGDAQYGTSVGIVDYSRKETDDFGNYVIIERRFTKKAEYDVKINPSAVSSVQRTLADYRVTPVVWIGDEEMQETIVYGYYKSFDITLASMAWADATITVEGL